MDNSVHQQAVNSTDTLPELLSERHRTAYGFSRTGWYRLLNRKDVPVVRIGERKYLHRKKFEAWLEDQAQSCTR